ncbi:uncharacterized protein LOC112593197 [Melanaphis sacchari]|uniref:uncharacterized protein LOC112593197 n=1 Tax=Melanaphis sacchari TaxID=742174 RepID=UPI000DC13B8E|nr:uncharacterized protein LOC112593197 [Melanaphis sacchari]
MEIDEDLSAIEANPIARDETSESFGDISCITNDCNEKENENPHTIETDESDQEDIIMSGSESGIVEDFTYDPTALIEISDILDLVGKNWSIFRVSPLWNLNFDTNYLNLLSKKLKKFLMNHTSTNMKNQKNSFSEISVEIEAKEANHECIALKINVFNNDTNSKLYTGLLLKSPNYNQNYSKNNLSDMPILMVQGNKSISVAIHNWLTEYFDCVIRPFEFALYQFLWLIAISMGDAGPLYNETVLYHYLYKYESSKGQMDVKCYAESEFLQSVLAKLSLNRSSPATTSFHYSDLIKVQSDIEDHFKITCGINVSKLKLKAFEAPKVASINVSGKIQVWSSTLIDLMLKYLMELQNNKCMP